MLATPYTTKKYFDAPKQISERPYEERALHNAARNVAVLYKRGTYGLLTHCPLTTEDLALIEAEIEDILQQALNDLDNGIPLNFLTNC